MVSLGLLALSGVLVGQADSGTSVAHSTAPNY